MKTLYINITNEQIQSNEELEVLKHDLDGDFFFYLGEKIAKSCKVENGIALITDFNTQDNAEDYQKIIAQWNDLKAILFGEECKGHFEFTLPNGYIHWLKFHPQYVDIYDKNFSHGESAVISVDLEELYEESVKSLLGKILRTLKRNDLYLKIDKIVFNDVVVGYDSLLVNEVLNFYNNIKFKCFDEFLKLITFKHFESNVQSEIVDDERNYNDDVDVVVNWLCDEFKNERGGDLRNFMDETKLRDIAINAISDCKNSCDNAAKIYMLCQKYGANGNLIYKTRFERRMSKDLLYALTHPEELEDRAWGWESVRTLNNGMEVKKYNYKYGLVDSYGIVVVQCEYNEIMQLKSGSIRLQKNGKYGLIDKDKTINLSCIYDEILDFENGLVKVKINGRWIKINESDAILKLKESNKQYL
ncbi:MAG: WG repeat-containing protein [Bacteroides sp.]|nr:WG repeat-containing protein [Bacteroides sp.]